MAADDDLRLAWLAERDGRPGRRDALLTLAAAEAGAEGAPWAEGLRDRLVAGRPDHFFASHRSLPRALADPRVATMLDRLRGAFPPARVRWLLQRADAGRGPYTGRRPSRSALLDDLLRSPWPPRRSRRDRAVRTLPTPMAPVPPRDSARPPVGPAAPTIETARDVVAFYLAVLLSIAALLSCALGTPQPDAPSPS